MKFLCEALLLQQVFLRLVHFGLGVSYQLLLRRKFFGQRLYLDIRLLQVFLSLFGGVGSYSELIIDLLHLFIVSLFGLVHHYGVHL